MAFLNCWEFKNCGREVGGAKSLELGVCPAANTSKVNGINDGINGGRACWALAGTLCGGIIQGTFANKISNCMQCDFYKKVLSERGKNLTKSIEIINLMK